MIQPHHIGLVDRTKLLLLSFLTMNKRRKQDLNQGPYNKLIN